MVSNEKRVREDQNQNKKTASWTWASTITTDTVGTHRWRARRAEEKRTRTHFMCDSSIIKHLVLLLLNNIKFNTI